MAAWSAFNYTAERLTHSSLLDFRTCAMLLNIGETVGLLSVSWTTGVQSNCQLDDLLKRYTVVSRSKKL